MKNYTISKSRALHERASKIIVGGVNSPARAFRSVGGDPLFADHAQGCHLWDADGNRYIDYICSWGPLIAGHTHPEVIKAVKHAAARGTSFGMSTESEILLAEKIRTMLPSIEMIRMVNSGTEAAMSAIRLARGYTGKRKIIKFAGCYHGHGDSFLIKAGSGAMTLGVPDSAGITPGTSAETLVAEFNNVSQVAELIAANPGEVAAIIVEPVVGNMGTVLPAPGFLEGLRDLTIREGNVLIFDEVMTGFRLARGGAQELYGVIPDLTTLGKIVGGGLPVGAYGGRAEIMSMLAPLGPVYQAGTLSGNPLAMSAGLATISLIDNEQTYADLEITGSRLARCLRKAAEASGMQVTVNRCGSMFTLFFNPGPVTDYPSASRSNVSLFARFFRGMLERGVLLPPSQFEAAFISTAHDEEAVDETIRAAEETFERMKKTV
ncbi:MAG: glutamate-1-semialdehyde 2,1-aminomutase [Candidatus Latescibacter sp.]|nr:glutamate-1-semialdehyde 2,1-aminomutase [Candidatus Latescibacter sp.]